MLKDEPTNIHIQRECAYIIWRTLGSHNSFSSPLGSYVFNQVVGNVRTGTPFPCFSTKTWFLMGRISNRFIQWHFKIRYKCRVAIGVARDDPLAECHPPFYNNTILPDLCVLCIYVLLQSCAYMLLLQRER